MCTFEQEGCSISWRHKENVDVDNSGGLISRYGASCCLTWFSRDIFMFIEMSRVVRLYNKKDEADDATGPGRDAITTFLGICLSRLEIQEQDRDISASQRTFSVPSKTIATCQIPTSMKQASLRISGVISHGQAVEHPCCSDSPGPGDHPSPAVSH